ncbi:MAG: DUF4239 domain-containing protein [Candidatus Levybacteria bacterium]|nr:DUF4239 domain-containing protein [Candidatus Levybacteria bacterium]
MEMMKTELLATTAKLYERIYTRSIIIKIIIFTVGFTLLFFYVRTSNIIPEYKLEADRFAIPALFGAGNLIFSVISAFVIQAQWSKWDRLVDANRGEITMFRQLYILSHHFPKDDMNEIRYHIYNYLKTYIDASDSKNIKLLSVRSTAVDNALIKIEDSVFNASKKHPDVGQMVFSYLTRAMEYRERKIQYTNQRLPQGMKIYLYGATYSVIFGSLFVPFNYIGYNYYFTLVVALLAFGVLLIIEDFDHPYRPGSFVLTVRLYQVLLDEIKLKLEQRGFDIGEAQLNETNDYKKIV